MPLNLQISHEIDEQGCIGGGYAEFSEATQSSQS